MQFQDPSAGGYGGAGGAAGAVDEDDDDGKRLLVNSLHTMCSVSCCTLVFACVCGLHGAAVCGLSLYLPSAVCVP